MTFLSNLDDEYLLNRLNVIAYQHKTNPTVPAYEIRGIKPPDFFKDQGRKLLKNGYRWLHRVLCDSFDDDELERKHLLQAMPEDIFSLSVAIATLLITTAGVSPYLAPVIAVFAARLIKKGPIEELCFRLEIVLSE